LDLGNVDDLDVMPCRFCACDVGAGYGVAEAIACGVWVALD